MRPTFTSVSTPGVTAMCRQGTTSPLLDGLERILLAYARMDAAHLPDDNLDEQTANNIAQFYGLSDNV